MLIQFEIKYAQSSTNIEAGSDYFVFELCPIMHDTHSGKGVGPAQA